MAHRDDRDPASSTIPLVAKDEAHPLPTPVRASLGDAQGDTRPEDAPRTTADFEADGASWSVRVGGKGRSGAASAPILLLLFEKSGGSEGDAREAWIVGDSLAHLTELEVEGAFRKSAPTPGAWSQKPLFPEAGSRSGKDG